VALHDLVPEQYRGTGLTVAELDAIQDQASAPFPPDLCELLTATLPTGPGFPDWRTRPREMLAAFREQVIDGIEFDATHNGIWLESWGEKPTGKDELREVVAQNVRDAPVLIPIYSHRALPNEPLQAGNPVYSIMQTDIIFYGANLAEYLRHEFGHEGWAQPTQPLRTIRFWSDLAS
jgi:hypothetical protein